MKSALGTEVREKPIAIDLSLIYICPKEVNYDAEDGPTMRRGWDRLRRGRMTKNMRAVSSEYVVRMMGTNVGWLYAEYAQGREATTQGNINFLSETVEGI